MSTDGQNPETLGAERDWSDRLFGGFRKTTERLSENLSGIVGKTTLEEAQLDDIEDALIMSDLGPRAAARIRARLAAERFERDADERAIMEVVAREIAEILRPVAKPLDVVAFPRPQVILVIGVNGSGKTTTIAKLAHLFQEQDYSVMLAAGDTFRPDAEPPPSASAASGRTAWAFRWSRAPRAATRPRSCSTRSRPRPNRASTH